MPRTVGVTLVVLAKAFAMRAESFRPAAKSLDNLAVLPANWEANKLATRQWNWFASRIKKKNELKHKNQILAQEYNSPNVTHTNMYFVDRRRRASTKHCLTWAIDETPRIPRNANGCGTCVPFYAGPKKKNEHCHFPPPMWRRRGHRCSTPSRQAWLKQLYREETKNNKWEISTRQEWRNKWNCENEHARTYRLKPTIGSHSCWCRCAQWNHRWTPPLWWCHWSQTTTVWLVRPASTQNHFGECPMF